MINQFQLINAERRAADEKEQARRAQIRDYFFLQDNAMIQFLLKEDLKKWVVGADISRMKLITFDSFVKAFLEKICQVHTTPPIIKFNEEINKETLERFKNLLNEVQLIRILQDNDLKMRLHNTILTGVRYYDKLDRLYLDNTFNVGTTTVIPYEGFETEAKYVIRKKMTKAEEEIWLVWDRETKDQYYIKDEPKYDYDTETLLNDKIYLSEMRGEMYFPFITYRYQDQSYGFWQLGMDSLIELLRIINILFTVCGDDTIQETIRLLILNFDPVGKEDEKGMKAGLRHPLIVEGLDRDPTAQVISADLYNNEIMKLIDNLISILSSLHGIDSLTKAYLEKSLSGVSIRLRNEPILQQWQKDINIVRQYDINLIKKIVEVNNYHRENNQIDVKILDKLIIDYQSPHVVTDEKEDYELDKLKWDDGVSSPVLWVMRQNPEWGEIKAIQFVKDNLKVTNELFGLNITEPKPEPEPLVE
ncbi:MAG: hypothetical protein K8R79_07315 [Calditrichales bacterium]|nr:hypothetical protein [Calditrichales bacterium]